jgi:hypothetical protein
MFVHILLKSASYTRESDRAFARNYDKMRIEIGVATSCVAAGYEIECVVVDDVTAADEEGDADPW